MKIYLTDLLPDYPGGLLIWGIILTVGSAVGLIVWGIVALFS